MTDHSRLSEASKGRLLVQRVYLWCIPILYSMGIAAILGTVMIAVIVLDHKGLLPSWFFGWISSDREIQKRQFLRTLIGLFILWFLTRIVKWGGFGEVAGTTYTRIFSKLIASDRKSHEEIHARTCAVRNVRSALFLVGFFTLEVFLSSRALGKPFSDHNLYELLFQI